MLGLSSRTLAFQSISIETHFWADQSQFYFLKLKSKLLTQARAKMSVKFMSRRRDKRCILFSMICTLLCQVYQRIISSRDFVSLKISQLVHTVLYILLHYYCYRLIVEMERYDTNTIHTARHTLFQPKRETNIRQSRKRLVFVWTVVLLHRHRKV